MKKCTIKIIVSGVVLAVCIGAILGIRFLSASIEDNPLAIISSRVKGNSEAEVQIVEYADFRCGHCSHGAVWLKNFMKTNADKVRVEFRYFPLNLRDGAFASRFVECALKQGKFWEVNEALMIRQKEWMHLANPTDFFLTVAENKKLDIEKLTFCWNNPAIYDDIIAIKQQGKDLGVKATPTYFINGKMVVGNTPMTEEVLGLLGMKSKEGAK